MATYVVYSTGGYLNSQSGTWTEVQNGTATYLQVIDDFYNAIVEFYSPGNLQATEAFLSFDTSAISANEVSVSVRFAFQTYTVNPIATLRFREHTWSTPLATGDWVPASNLAAKTLIVEYVSPTASTIYSSEYSGSLTSPVGVIAHDAKLESSVSPELDDFYGTDIEYDYTPRLIVHTVQPSTLMGVHDAAVQLSDGSTVYLEADGTSGATVPIKHVDTLGTVTTWYYGYEYFEGLQAYALCVDGNDNTYVVFHWPDSPSIGIDAYNSSGTYLGSASFDSGVNGIQHISAVWCDAGSGVSNQGRLLIAAFGADGQACYSIIDANHALINAGYNATLATDSGTNPSWLVPSSAYRNQSGTGLSLATDVFGGTKVGVFSWSNNALTSSTVAYATQMATLTVGSTISSVTTDTGLTAFDLTDQIRGKIVSYGTNQFVGLWNTSTGVTIKRFGTSGYATLSGVTYFDAVWDENNEAVWVYYFSTNDLMRRPYYPATGALGTAETVTTDATGTKNFIRTVKKLRNPLYAEVHFNRTT